MSLAADFLLAPWYYYQARKNVQEADRLLLEADCIMHDLGRRLPPGWRDKFEFVYRNNGEYVLHCADADMSAKEQRDASLQAIRAAFKTRAFATSARDQLVDLEGRLEGGIVYIAPANPGEAVPDYLDTGRASLEVSPTGPVPQPPSYAYAIAMRPPHMRTLSMPI